MTRNCGGSSGYVHLGHQFQPRSAKGRKVLYSLKHTVLALWSQ